MPFVPELSLAARFLVSIAGGVGVTLTSALPAEAQITVGPNVHVSANHPTDGIKESWIAADPADPNRLLACTIVDSPASNKAYSAAYLSTDSGLHWRETLETASRYGINFGDPWCTFGPNGTAHFVTLYWARTRTALGVFRSSDGGATWQEQRSISSPVRNPMDNESITADVTGGRFAGHVYITATSSIQRADSVRGGTGWAMWTSTDGGITFANPTKRASPPGQHALGTGSGVVLRDGTFIFPANENVSLDPRLGMSVPSVSGEPNALLSVFSSTDGGETLEPAVKVADRVVKPGWDVTTLGSSLAVDLSHGPFADRLYIVWVDAPTGHSQVLLSTSRDNGRTWSAPQVINDYDDQPAAENVRAAVFMPNVAVNRDGAVGVGWYDRHGIRNQMGWNTRFRASLDGGETWLPSVRVSSSPNTYGGTERFIVYTHVRPPIHELTMGIDWREFDAGDYSGMAADANGVFHPVWTDNRLGLPQLWTAAISVGGAVTRHGDAQLDALDDVGDRLAFLVTNTRLDRASGAVTLTAQLKNLSRDTLRGPLFVRARSLSTELADSVRATNANNGRSGGGAVWEFTMADGFLAPGALTVERPMTFRLMGLRPVLDDRPRQTNLVVVNMPLVVLARTPQRP